MTYKNVFQRKREKQKATSPILRKRIYALQLALLGTLIISALSVLPNTVQYARASEDVYEIAANAPVGEVILGYSIPLEASETIENKIKRITAKYGVSYERISKTIACENHELDPNLQSYMMYTFNDPKRGIVKGERERSFGISMIHLPDHPEISLTEAIDPDFAIEWMVKEWSKGHKGMWSCAKMLGYAK